MKQVYSNKQENKPITNPIKDKNFYTALGDNFMSKNEYRLAVKEYLLSLMIDKNDIAARVGASKAYKNLREYDKAIKHLKTARNVYGFSSEIYYELGINYLLNSDSENAQKNFMRTIKLSPDNRNAQVKLALTHELSGEDDMAILVYSTIIEKNPTYIPALSNLANLYIDHKEYEEAISCYQKILKINDRYHRAYLGMGLCFDKMDKYSHAIRFYKKYISLKPESQTAHALVGRILDLHNKRKSSSKKPLKIVS